MILFLISINLVFSSIENIGNDELVNDDEEESGCKDNSCSILSCLEYTNKDFFIDSASIYINSKKYDISAQYYWQNINDDTAFFRSSWDWNNNNKILATDIKTTSQVEYRMSIWRDNNVWKISLRDSNYATRDLFESSNCDSSKIPTTGWKPINNLVQYYSNIELKYFDNDYSSNQNQYEKNLEDNSEALIEDEFEKKTNNNYIQKKQCNKSCEFNNKCYPYGTRISNKYCSLEEGFLFQLKDKSFCEYDYECVSNSCIDDQCYSENIFEKITKIFNTIKNILLSIFKKLLFFN